MTAQAIHCNTLTAAPTLSEPLVRVSYSRTAFLSSSVHNYRQDIRNIFGILE